MNNLKLPKHYSEILEYVQKQNENWIKSNIKKLKSERDILPIICDYVSFNSIIGEGAYLIGMSKGISIIYGEFSFVSFFGLGGSEGWESMIPDSFAGNRLYWALMMRLIKQVEFPAVAEMALRRSLRPGRIKVPLADRCQIAAKYAVLEGVYRSFLPNYGVSAKSFAQEWKRIWTRKINILRSSLQSEADSCTDELKKITDGEIVRVYRGFEVDEDQDIRLGRKLLNNKDATVFAPRYGISFSKERSTALAFARARNSSVFGGEWGSRLNASQLLLESYSAKREKLESDMKRRRVLGVFEANIADILICQLGMTGEDELVIFPDKVKVKKYKLI